MAYSQEFLTKNIFLLHWNSTNKDLRWNSKSQLMERDAPELPGIVIVMSGATRAMQQAMNLQ